MEPKTALIITLVGIAFLLVTMGYLAFQCNVAIKKLKSHGETIFSKKKK
jgi:hypothetical protein